MLKKYLLIALISALLIGQVGSLYVHAEESLVSENPDAEFSTTNDDKNDDDEIKDYDGDGIPDSIEEGYYTVEFDEFDWPTIVVWDALKHDEEHYVKYKTSRFLESTDRDPYSDYEEVTGLGYEETNNSLIAMHPMVAAYPEVVVYLDNFIMAHIENDTGSTGGSKSLTLSNTSTDSETDTESYSDSVSATVSAKVGTSGASASTSVSVSETVGESQARTTSLSQTNGNTSTDTWSNQISLNTGDVANLTLEVRYKNVGTAPIYNATPYNTVTSGSNSLYSFAPRKGDIVETLNPGGQYPLGNETLAVTTKDDFSSQPITVSKANLDIIQENGGFTMRTTQFGGDYLKDGKFYPWSTLENLIDGGTATISIDSQDGGLVTRHIAARREGVKVDEQIEELTLGEAIELGFGATRNADGHLMYENRAIDTGVNIQFILNEHTLKTINEDFSDIDSIWDIPLRAKMKFRIQMMEGAADVSIVDYAYRENSDLYIDINKENDTKYYYDDIKVIVTGQNSPKILPHLKEVEETEERNFLIFEDKLNEEMERVNETSFKASRIHPSIRYNNLACQLVSSNPSDGSSKVSPWAIPEYEHYDAEPNPVVLNYTSTSATIDPTKYYVLEAIGAGKHTISFENDKGEKTVYKELSGAYLDGILVDIKPNEDTTKIIIGTDDDILYDMSLYTIIRKE